MSKLFPPYIEGILPAISLTYPTTQISIPFSHNPSVSEVDIQGYSLLIKTVSTSEKIMTLTTNSISIDNVANFILQGEEIKQLQQYLGEYLKFQLAYIQNDAEATIGHYSTVGVAKLCYSASVSINTEPSFLNNSLSKNKINFLNSNIIYGTYISINDSTEKVYSYKFSLYDNQSNLLETSGIQLHNNKNDVSSETSYDMYKIKTILQQDIEYYLYYEVITTNKLILSCFRKIAQQPSIPPINDLNLIANSNIDNGYIQLSIDTNNITISGKYILLRSDETSNFQKWQQILNFAITSENGKIEIWKDLAIEQGIGYQYAIQQYNQYFIYTDKILSNKIKAEFEDLFLFDGTRQLNIRFNPQVSAIKDTILEQKIETIGNQYPFIFRNGKIKYKEFNINGLISYNMDKEQMFIKGIDLGVLEDTNARSRTAESPLSDQIVNVGYNTHISALNTTIERKFKLKVLEWLENGKIKCLKSPTEGNYLVKLTNVSLSPENQTGRMLHSFSATAYEIEDYNLENILNLWYQDKIEQNLIDNIQKQYVETTVSLRDLKNTNNILLNEKYKIVEGIKNVWFQDILPGTQFKILYQDRTDNGNINSTVNITINNTGNLSIENLPQGQSIQNINLINNNDLQDFETGQITFGYYAEITDNFNHLINFEQQDIIGEQYQYNKQQNGNLIDYLNNIKFSVPKFYAIQFNKIDSTLNHIQNKLQVLNLDKKNTVITKKDYNFITSIIPEIKPYFSQISTQSIRYKTTEDIISIIDSTIGWQTIDKRINWYIIADNNKINNQNEQNKSWLDKKNSLLYLDNLENIKYIEVGPNVEVIISYKLFEKIYDVEEEELINKVQQILNISNSSADVIFSHSLEHISIMQKYEQAATGTDKVYYWFWEYQCLKRIVNQYAETATEDSLTAYLFYYRLAVQNYTQYLSQFLLEKGV